MHASQSPAIPSGYSPEVKSQPTSQPQSSFWPSWFRSSPPKETFDSKLKERLSTLTSKTEWEEFDHLMQEMIEQAIQKKDGEIPFQALEFLKPEVILTLMQEKFELAKDWAEKVSQCLAEQKNGSPVHPSDPGNERNCRIITHFLLNLGRLLWRVCKLLESRSPPVTLYEYGVLITIYFHFLKIPYFLLKGISQFFPKPAQALAITIAIHAIAISVFAAYLKWFRGCPTQVSYLTHMPKESPDGTYCENIRKHVCSRISAKMGEGHQKLNVLIIGQRGVGKSAFIHDLPKHFPNLEFFQLDNFRLFTAATMVMNAGEKMSLATQEVEGYKEKVIFCCDEIGDVLQSTDPSFQIFFQPFLEDRSIQIVAALTEAQYKALKKKYESFFDRFSIIHKMDPTDEASTLSILRQRLKQRAPGISFTGKGLKKCMELGDELREDAQPRSSIMILDEIVSRIQNFQPDLYTPASLTEAEMALNNWQQKVEEDENPLEEPDSGEWQSFVKDIQDAKDKLSEEKRKAQEQRTLASQCIHAMQMKKILTQKRDQCVLEMHQKGTDDLVLKMKMLVINFVLLRKLKEQIQVLSSQLNDDIPLALDVKQVEILRSEQLDKKEEKQPELGESKEATSN